MTYSSALQEISALFERARLENPRRQAEWILEDVGGVERSILFAYPERPMREAAWRQCMAIARRRIDGEPLQYLIGHTDFHGLRIQLTTDVLIPRPETEQLVSLVLDSIPVDAAPRILDVGTGSGCIVLALVAHRGFARGWACDVHADALAVAYRNSVRLGLPLSFFLCDALQPGFAHAFAGMLDVVVSNPPYVSRDEMDELPFEVRGHEPHRALFTPEDPLAFYHAIADESARVLRPGGSLFFETHEDRADGVANILEDAGFVSVGIGRDYAERDRFVWGRARRGLRNA